MSGTSFLYVIYYSLIDTTHNTTYSHPSYKENYDIFTLTSPVSEMGEGVAHGGV